MSTAIGGMVRRLVARDPRGVIDDVLALLEADTDATGSALFAQRERDLELVALRHARQDGLDRVRDVWVNQQGHLRDGRPIFQDCWCLWPLEAGSPEMTERTAAKGRGLLYLESEGSALRVGAVRSAVIEGEQILVTALAARPETPASPAETEERDASEGARRRLLIVLTDCEWNLSQAARALGVTRVTVYQRMRRFGIERIKLRKSRPLIVA